VTGNQRWAEGRDSYRPPAERIQPREYEVAAIADDRTARAFVEQHHYSRSYPAARVRVGLYRRGQLVGVAVFSHPCNDRVLTNTFRDTLALEAVELGRFVLLDEVPGNGETWFLARCFELLRQRALRGVVSFSDPVPRTTVDGRVVFPGHLGTIYQAHNARYLGRGAAGLLRVLPDGTILSHRTEQKIRAGHRGWRAAVALLSEHGADVIPDGASREVRLAWLATWLPQLTRRIRHPGNHKYAWSLNRRVQLAPGVDYPKLAAA
jgi:hypothetical protein